MKKGTCVICGAVGRLTRDHVPPKGAVRPESLLIQALSEYVSQDATPQRPAHLQFRARAFRTLCKNCNGNLLGNCYDPALAALTNSVATWVRARFDHNLSLPADMVVTARQADVARAVVGHLLAADEKPARSLRTKAPLQEAMRAFFLGKDGDPQTQLHVHVWPYPASPQVVIRGFGIASLAPPRYESPVLGDLFKFYPLAFLVSNYPAAIPGFRIGTLEVWGAQEASELRIPLKGTPYPQWPEQMRDHEALMVGDHVAYVASPEGARDRSGKR